MSVRRTVQAVTTAALLGALLVVAPGSAAAAEQVIDFSAYPFGTSANDISEPGVTFTVTAGAARVIGSSLQLNPDANFAPSAVTITLAREAAGISFFYSTSGNCNRPINTIQLYQSGTKVDDTTVSSCAAGTYSRTVAFDEVRLFAGRVTNAERMSIGSITLTYPNRAPVAVDDAYSTPEGTGVAVTAPGVLGNDTDADGDALTAAVVTGPANGTLVLGADGAFTYAPAAPDFVGSDSFVYAASDGEDSDQATVTITVTEVVPAGCTQEGTAGNDTLVGTSGPDVICGLGGDDLIQGLGGNDRLIGGSGADRVDGGSGDDVVEGRSGNDVLLGGSGRDSLDGGSGDDTLNGGSGIDTCRAEPGDTPTSC